MPQKYIQIMCSPTYAILCTVLVLLNEMFKSEMKVGNDSLQWSFMINWLLEHWALKKKPDLRKSKLKVWFYVL